MARGNGHKAQAAVRSGKLSGFVRPTDNASNSGQNREFVDWGEVSPQLVFGSVAGVVKHGGALLLGCSRDKSSYSVKVYASGEGTPYYFPCTENGLRDLEAFLTSLSDLYMEPLE